MARHKASVEEIKSALKAGMKTGYEMGYDAAIGLVAKLEDAWGEHDDVFSRELKKTRDTIIAKSHALLALLNNPVFASSLTPQRLESLKSVTTDAQLALDAAGVKVIR